MIMTIFLKDGSLSPYTIEVKVTIWHSYPGNMETS